MECPVHIIALIATLICAPTFAQDSNSLTREEVEAGYDATEAKRARVTAVIERTPEVGQKASDEEIAELEQALVEADLAYNLARAECNKARLRYTGVSGFARTREALTQQRLTQLEAAQEATAAGPAMVEARNDYVAAKQALAWAQGETRTPSSWFPFERISNALPSEFDACFRPDRLPENQFGYAPLGPSSD